MSSLNMWVGSGRLTRDSELKYTKTGKPVLNMGMCCNRNFKDSNNQLQEEATFLDLVWWGSQTEKLAEYLVKGKFVEVRGRLRTESWEQDGSRRSKLVVVVEELNFTPSSNGGETVAAASSSEQDDTPF